LKTNFFKEIEKRILYEDEEILFDDKKIREISEKLIIDKINKIDENKKGLFFEEIICDFFEYKNFEIFRTKKTRDFGLDGLIELKIEPFGNLKLGLQIKYKKVGSEDIDLLINALNFAEIKMGVLVCKDSGRLDKYNLSSKLKAMLIGKENKIEIKENLDINPVFILKFSDILDIFSQSVRDVVRSVYKKWKMLLNLKNGKILILL